MLWGVLSSSEVQGGAGGGVAARCLHRQAVQPGIKRLACQHDRTDVRCSRVALHHGKGAETHAELSEAESQVNFVVVDPLADGRAKHLQVWSCSAFGTCSGCSAH